MVFFVSIERTSLSGNSFHAKNDDSFKSERGDITIDDNM